MKNLTIVLFTLLPLFTYSQKTVYLIPGQGADGRLFQNLSLKHDTTILHYIIPEKGETMESYALRMSQQIDTTSPFSIVGVSLGGMIAVEMSKFLNPEEVVIIASAKTRSELPARYRFMKYVPFHKVFGGKFYIKGAKLAQPLFEPVEKEYAAVFQAMLSEKHPDFMKRAVNCIVKWENTEVPDNVYHIHGENDHTLPIKNLDPTVTIEDGTHMMTLVRAEELSVLINGYLK